MRAELVRSFPEKLASHQAKRHNLLTPQSVRLSIPGSQLQIPSLTLSLTDAAASPKNAMSTVIANPAVLPQDTMRALPANVTILLELAMSAVVAHSAGSLCFSMAAAVANITILLELTMSAIMADGAILLLLVIVGAPLAKSSRLKICAIALAWPAGRKWRRRRLHHRAAAAFSSSLHGSFSLPQYFFLSQVKASIKVQSLSVNQAEFPQRTHDH